MRSSLVLVVFLLGLPFAYAGGQKKAPQAEEKKPAETPLPPLSGGELTPLPPSDLPPPPEGFREVRLSEATPTKPSFNLLDLHGYLRLRGDLMDGLNLGLSPRTDPNGAPYPQFPSTGTGRDDTVAGANMRFRLEPTINISEDLRINLQIDMLDNLVLGSTPDGYPRSAYYPLVVLSEGQQPPVEGVNAIKDSILVKRVWGEVKTPLGHLRFGRMGSQWGLGLLENDGGPMFVDRGPLVTQRDRFSNVGDCFDCDYGSTADRIMFITQLFGHYVIPMVDFTSEGPTYTFPNEWSGQPWDLDQLDDVTSWSLAITKRDKPEDIQDALARDGWVFNYGAYFVFKNQAYDAVDFQTSSPYAGKEQNIQKYAVRNAEAYIPDFWVRLMVGKLRLELEAVMIFGHIGYDAMSGSFDAQGQWLEGATVRGQRIDLFQWGGVFQGEYLLFNDTLHLGFEAGLASGDDSPGFGVRPFAEKQFNHPSDNNITNFRFHPDYHVDLILWRQILGTVTDAMYVKPRIRYDISKQLGAQLSAIYSMAMDTSSTRGKSSPLGLEFDFDFFYFSDDNFHAGLSYGLLIPFAGMNDLGDDMSPGGIAQKDLDREAEIAHRILGRLVLFF